MYKTDANGILTGALVFLISAIVVSVGFIPSTANVVIGSDWKYGNITEH